MSAISTAIELTDRISAPLNRIQATLYGVTSAFDAVDTASNRCLDSFQVEAVAQEMMRYERQIEDVETELIQANAQIERMQKETDEAADEANKLQTSFGNIAGVIGGLGIAYIVQDQVRQAIAYASDLTEVQNVVDVSFGQSAKVVDEWAKTTLEAYGINELSAKQYAGTMGAMLKSSGVAGEAVTDMSMRIAELSGDMASFYNLSADDAFYKIRAGISGETEPLKQLGINMSVANLEAYALSQGISTTYDKMTQAEQTLLRYNYLMAVSADAHNDFTRTAGSYANQQRLLTENVRQFTGELANGLIPILTAAMMALNDSVMWVKENWSALEPLVIGLTTAIGLYTAALVIGKTIMLGYAAVTALQSVATSAWSVVTFAQTVAQSGLNAALLACPITWIIIGIIALIAIIYAAAQAVANMTDSVNTGFGIIMGVVAVAIAFLYNSFMGVLNAIIQLFWTIFVYPFLNIIEFVINAFNGGFNTFGDAVANLIGKIIGWFLLLGTVVTKIIDAIFGTDWTSGLNALQDSVVEWGKNEEAITLNRNFEGFDRAEYGEAFDVGTEWGDGVAAGIGDKIDAFKNGLTGSDAVSDATAMNEIAANTGNSAAGVDKISKSVDISNEQLQYMRDLAEQEVINRFTTVEIKVDMTNNNTINNGMDIDGVINQLGDGVQEVMQVAAEGVH
ncbi:hypothetical protein [uncultured Phascolarctobacterium sp.]|uniref:hypothetical protein n=1 Tax=uncultured Phascolarctobacterium sp. TaxID=512296 RepID=UPI0027D99F2E|nr:hypothetical protein [uncultured Phascolarctobacterium sp.]